MWFPGKDVGPSPDFFEPLPGHLESGLAAQDHGQHLTLSRARNELLPGGQHQKLKVQQIARIVGKCIQPLSSFQ